MPAICLRPGFKSGKLLCLRLLSFLVLSLVGMQALGQHSEKDHPAYLRMNEVNSRAARHFLSHFSLATRVNWSRDDHYYIASFNDDNSRTRVYYKSNGNFVLCLKYYPGDALNGVLKSAILKKFPGCQIMVITELTDDLYKQALFVNIKYGLNVETLRCDDEGIEVTENIKNAGI